MFWIIGGLSVVRALTDLLGWEWLSSGLAYQTEHAGWAGVRAWDLIFPLFIFVSGVTMPYVITRRLEQGVSKMSIQVKLLRRGGLLVFLGALPMLVRLNWFDVRWYTVLWLIGMAYFIAGTIVLHRPIKGQISWCIGLLVGTWVALEVVPIPGVGAGVITPTHSVFSYLDRNLLHMGLYMGVFDPEGTLRILPAAAMALMGALTGSYLRSRPEPHLSVSILLLSYGIGCLGLGIVWGTVQPMIKSLWSPSFAVYCAGWSLLLLSLFYTVIDVWKQKWFGWFWIPIGMNALAIYVGARFIPFRDISDWFLAALADMSGPYKALILAVGVMTVKWLLLWWMKRHKVFVKV